MIAAVGTHRYYEQEKEKIRGDFQTKVLISQRFKDKIQRKILRIWQWLIRCFRPNRYQALIEREFKDLNKMLKKIPMFHLTVHRIPLPLNEYIIAWETLVNSEQIVLKSSVNLALEQVKVHKPTVDDFEVLHNIMKKVQEFSQKQERILSLKELSFVNFIKEKQMQQIGSLHVRQMHFLADQCNTLSAKLLILASLR